MKELKMKKLLLLLLGSSVTLSILAMTPLHQAVANNDADLVDKLIKGGADINAGEEYSGSTPLMYIRPGTPDKPYIPLLIAKKLVTHGANVNAHDRSGWTPLIFLASQYLEDFNSKQKQGINQVIGYLMAQGADVNAASPNSKRTPLFEAVFKGNPSIVHALLKSPEINFNIKSFYFGSMLTPIELARKLLRELHVRGFYKASDQNMVDLLDRAQQAQTQAYTESRREAVALARAQLPRLGAGSPARTLTSDDLQHIQKILERELYEEAMRTYLV